MTPAPMVERLRRHLSAPISIQSLAVLRMIFGAILVWDCWRYIRYTRIERYYVDVEMTFPYFGWDFIQPLPEPYIHWVWLLVGVSAFGVMIGLFFRASIILFILSFGYFFLLDKAQYLNHNYMVLLYAFLLALSPAHRAYSLDAWARPALRSMVIPRWPVSALKLQTEIILVYAGIVKITDDWLRGEPLRKWMHARIDDVWLAPIFQNDWILLSAAWGTVALHVLGAPLLLWRRTRIWVFVTYCCFHVSNAQFFNIGIFPWLTIAVTTIFFAPDWPERMARKLCRFFAGSERLPEGSTAPIVGRGVVQPASGALMAVLGLWFAVQLYLPERQAFFPNLVGWTGDGHRFSWRMRIYDRDAEGWFEVVGKDGREWQVDPEDFLTRRQARIMLTRTDMLHEFAARLEERWRLDGHEDVAVYAHIRKSLNGRPMQAYVDPSVDLTAVAYNLTGPDAWVMPLETRAAEDIMPAWWPPLPLQKPAARGGALYASGG